jgi:YVTN family beta-propeller protein
VLFNDTQVPGYFDSVASSLPSLEAFDGRNHMVFVEGFYSGVIDVISTRTNEVVGTIAAGTYPNTLAYDPVTNSLFFGQQTNDLVSWVNATTDLILRSINIGFEPIAMAVDPVSGDLYVTGWNTTGTAYLAVLSGTNGTVTTTETFGANRFPVAGPNGLAYDPTNGEFYIASIVGGTPGTRGNLTRVDAANATLLGNLALRFDPDAVLYAPSDGDLYLGNQSGTTLTVLNPTTSKVVTKVALPNTPNLLAYAPAHHQVLVGIDGNVAVVDTSTNSVATTFPVTRQPDGLAVDTLDGDVYISDYVWNNVSVVNSTFHVVVGSILLGALPYNMAFDGANGDLYVADLESSQLIIVNGTTDRVTGYVPLGTTPYGVAYDPMTQNLYIDDYDAGNVSVVNGTTNRVAGYLPAGVEPWGIAYDGADHDIVVTNPGSNNLTVLNPSLGTVVRNVNFSTPPGAIAYDAKSSTLFVGEYDVGNVSVLNARTDALIRTSSTGSEPYTIAVDPHTGDAFVGNYASDNITVLGPRGQELNTSDPAGVGVFGSAYDPVDGDVYVASFSTESVTVVNGTSRIGIGGYTVGTGPVAVAVDPVTGTVFVANYDSGSLTLLTPPPRATTFNVTFRETGLPPGKLWSVAFHDMLQTTNGSTVAFPVANGSYTYVVFGPKGYPVSSVVPEGAIRVNGSAVAQTIAFAKGTTYSLTFHESGLATGVRWCVTVGSPRCSSTTSVTISNATNGTYAFHVATVGSSTPSPASGPTTINGANVRVTIRFS